MPTAFDLSTSTAISWPRESRLSLWKVSTCGSWSILWLPGINLHVAVLGRRLGERDPGGHHVVGIEAPVGRVLVPGHEARVVRLLDEEVGGPAQDVRPDHVLDRVEDLRVVHQFVGPGEEEVASCAASCPAAARRSCLVLLQAAAVAPPSSAAAGPGSGNSNRRGGTARPRRRQNLGHRGVLLCADGRRGPARTAVDAVNLRYD